MTNWLEEAERSHRISKQRTGRWSKKIAEKKDAISRNYEQHKDAYEAFIQIMYSLVQRVNSLPEEMREPFGKLKAMSKKTKLNNHLHFFTGSRREQKFNFFSFFRLKPTHAKHYKVLYIYLSKELGFVNLEIKENYLIRKRMPESGKESKSGINKSSRSKQRTHVIMKYAIAQLNEQTGLDIIDWLVFRKQVQDLILWKEIPIEDKQFF